MLQCNWCNSRLMQFEAVAEGELVQSKTAGTGGYCCSPAHHNGLLPARDNTGDVADNDGLPEDCAIENVANGAVGAQPHLLQVKFLYTRLVWCNGGALYAHTHPLHAKAKPSSSSSPRTATQTCHTPCN